MKIEKLYYFESAARQKSFTKAANECLVAQPAISHSIKSLEAELGFDVFIRDKKNISLTPQGEMFYNDVVKILNEYDEAVKKSRDFSEHINNRITIGLYGFNSIFPIIPILKNFKRSFPNVDLNFKRCYNTSYFESLESGKYDMVISYCYIDEFTYDDIIFKSLEKDTLLLAVPPESNLSGKDEILVEDLVNADRNIHILDIYENYMRNSLSIPHDKLKIDTDIELLHLSGFLNRDLILTTRDEMSHFDKSDYLIKKIRNLKTKAYHGIFYKKKCVNPLIKEFIDLI